MSNWLDNGGDLPDLNSRMFQEDGYIHVNKFRVESTPKWKVALWMDTIEFYCTLNDMTVYFENFGPHEVALIEWSKK